MVNPKSNNKTAFENFPYDISTCTQMSKVPHDTNISKVDYQRCEGFAIHVLLLILFFVSSIKKRAKSHTLPQNPEPRSPNKINILM